MSGPGPATPEPSYMAQHELQGWVSSLHRGGYCPYTGVATTAAVKPSVCRHSCWLPPPPQRRSQSFLLASPSSQHQPPHRADNLQNVATLRQAAVRTFSSDVITTKSQDKQLRCVHVRISRLRSQSSLAWSCCWVLGVSVMLTSVHMKHTRNTLLSRPGHAAPRPLPRHQPGHPRPGHGTVTEYQVVAHSAQHHATCAVSV